MAEMKTRLIDLADELGVDNRVILQTLGHADLCVFTKQDDLIEYSTSRLLAPEEPAKVVEVSQQKEAPKPIGGTVGMPGRGRLPTEAARGMTYKKVQGWHRLGETVFDELLYRTPTVAKQTSFELTELVTLDRRLVLSLRRHHRFHVYDLMLEAEAVQALRAKHLTPLIKQAAALVGDKPAIKPAADPETMARVLKIIKKDLPGVDRKKHASKWLYRGEWNRMEIAREIHKRMWRDNYRDIPVPEVLTLRNILNQLVENLPKISQDHSS